MTVFNRCVSGVWWLHEGRVKRDKSLYRSPIDVFYVANPSYILRFIALLEGACGDIVSVVARWAGKAVCQKCRYRPAGSRSR